MLAAYAEPGGAHSFASGCDCGADTGQRADVDSICAELFGLGASAFSTMRTSPTSWSTPRDIFCERWPSRARRLAFRNADDAPRSRIASRSVGRELTLERPFVDARMRTAAVPMP